MRRLNFGCGKDYKRGYDNIDIMKTADIKHDLNKFPYPIKTNSYDYIYCRHVLEHLQDIDKIFEELWRIGKPNAVIEIIVPHFNSEGAFADTTHIHYFTEFSFTNGVLSHADWKQKKSKFEIISIDSSPSIFGVIFPKFMRRTMSLVIRGIYKEIHLKLKVVK